MRMHPLVTVKKAATLLGVDKGTIREKLTTGELKGEVRRIGQKDKWFVYSGELDFLLESQRLPELEARTQRLSTQGLTDIFAVATPIEHPEEPIEVDIIRDDLAGAHDSPPGSGCSLPAQLARPSQEVSSLQLEQILSSLTKQFSQRLAEEQEKLADLKRIQSERDELSKENELLVEEVKQMREQLCARVHNPLKTLFARMMHPGKTSP